MNRRAIIVCPSGTRAKMIAPRGFSHRGGISRACKIPSSLRRLDPFQLDRNQNSYYCDAMRERLWVWSVMKLLIILGLLEVCGCGRNSTDADFTKALNSGVKSL